MFIIDGVVQLLKLTFKYNSFGFNMIKSYEIRNLNSTISTFSENYFYSPKHASYTLGNWQDQCLISIHESEQSEAFN